MSIFKVSVVVPAYNEYQSLPILLQTLVPLLEQYNDYEIIIVDDGSQDDTLKLLEKYHVENKHINYLSFSRNYGHQMALKAGLDYASGDCVISLDADMQHPPYLIPQMVEMWQKGSDVVYTIRTENEKIGWFKKTTSAIFYKFFAWISGIALPKGAADFRLMDRAVVETLRKYGERTLFLRGLVFQLGYKQTPLPYTAADRVAGESHYTLSKMIKLALAGIFSFSTRPLTMAIWLGLVVCFLGVLFTIYAIYAKFYLLGTISGWTSLMCVLLLLGGSQLIIMGILGQYIGLIFTEVKKRPNYVVAKSSIGGVFNE